RRGGGGCLWGGGGRGGGGGAGGGGRGGRGARRQGCHQAVHAAVNHRLEGRRRRRAGAVGRRGQLGHRRRELAVGLREARRGIGALGCLPGQASQLGFRLPGGGGD